MTRPQKETIAAKLPHHYLQLYVIYKSIILGGFAYINPHMYFRQCARHWESQLIIVNPTIK